MLRFILMKETFSEINQMRTEHYYTVDVHLPDIESRLTSGGCGESGYDLTKLVAIEVIGEPVETV